MDSSASWQMELLLGYLVAGFLGAYLLLRLLGRARAFQPFREQGPKSHFAKGLVPTGGGLVFVAGALVFWIVEYLLYSLGGLTSPWAERSFVALTVICMGTAICGLVGFVDDLMKLTKKATIGFPARYKFLLQLLIGVVASYLLTPESSRLAIPIIGQDWELSLPLTLILGALAFAGFVNGVNFADGLDGLAAGSVIITLIGLNLISVLLGHPHLAILSAAAIGLVLGFFILNLKPAYIFMGDTGSYALGALIALSFISAGLLVYAVLLGIVYIVEVGSVILQVAAFKLTGKRVLKMSPLHHHFELCGRREESIVAGFWFLQATGCAAAVALAA